MTLGARVFFDAATADTPTGVGPNHPRDSWNKQGAPRLGQKRQSPRLREGHVAIQPFSAEQLAPTSLHAKGVATKDPQEDPSAVWSYVGAQAGWCGRSATGRSDMRISLGSAV